MTGVAARRATPTDAATLARLKLESWRAAYPGTLPQALLDGLDLAEQTAGFAVFLAELPPQQRVWLADLGGAVAGFCRTGPVTADDADLGPRAAEVLGLYLFPERIGTGLGRWLFSHGVNDLLARGFAPVCVYAFAPNPRAVAFYRRHGFALDGRRRLDAQDGFGVEEVRLVRQP